MKTSMKLKTLLCLSLTFTSALWASDSVEDQIALTQNAVNIALGEVANGVGRQSISSVDGDAKIAAFNAAATKALADYEAGVRVRILMPLQILTQQYNQTLRNTTYPASVKAQVLDSIKTQLESMASERQATYLEVAQRLFAPMGDFPVAVNLTGYTGNQCSNYGYAYQQLQSSNGTALTAYGTFDRNICGDDKMTASSLAKSLGDLMRTKGALLTNQLSKGCFTSTCFYQTTNAYVLWSSMVSSILVRDLEVVLGDGTKLTIKAAHAVREPNNSYFMERRILVAHTILPQVNPGKDIPSLPADMGQDRIDALKRIEAQVTGATFKKSNCIKSVNQIKNTICRLPEGCLEAAELSYLASKSLGLTVPADRAACINQ